MPLDPRRVKALFNAALDLPDTAERPAFLDRECGDDEELRRRLGELLAAYDKPASALEEPLAADLEGPTFPDGTPAPRGAASATPTVDVVPPAPALDRTVTARREGVIAPIGAIIAGRYKLRQEIGEGGMGSVYLAEQTQPVKRQVALKLIKAGMDSQAVLARFESERQALALMDHPNIAKVLDAGSTESGRPYFVMELVKGIPLTDYCDRRRLGLPERLAIFRQVCSAVQHAHQKGVIHRDLKPTNILVESHDDQPVPKVIDFGLAKATSGLQLSEHSLYSAFGTVAGTPLYMAPEQATFNAIDIDTRADIYALGVILYELLTGSTPIPRETFKRAALDEMLRLVREVEPPTPSSRISSSDTLPNIAATRHTEPARLGRFVRGDLDWIVMKALAKERQRRYESAIALSQDIERFTNHEPVSAGPPTAAYRLRKFVRRNRPQVITASLVLLALVLGIVGTTLGLIEARRQAAEATHQKRIAVGESREREKARRAEADERGKAERRLTQIEKANEVLGSVFKDLNPRRAEKEGKPLPALLGEHLDRAAAQIEGDAIGDPLTVARLQATLGESQLGLSSPEKAIALLTKAHATLAAQLGEGAPDTLTAMNHLATGYQDVGRLDLALPLFEKTLELRKARLGEGHEDTIISMINLANARLADGKIGRALPMLEAASALAKARLGPNHRETLGSMANLASGDMVAGRHERAIPILEEAIALQSAQLGADHPDTLTSMNNLATCYQAAGQLGRAVTMFEETLALRKARLGPEHRDTIISMINLAEAYQAAGQLDRALPLGEKGLALAKSKLGPDHRYTLTGLNNVAAGSLISGNLDRAVSAFEETLALTRPKLGRDHPDTLVIMGNLAEAYRLAGKPDRALPLQRELADAWRRKTGPDSPPYGGALAAIGLTLVQKKSWADAESVLREALRVREAREPDDWRTFNTKSVLGAALLNQRKFAEAEPLLRDGYAGMKQRSAKIPHRAKVRLGEAARRIVQLYEDWGRLDQAAQWREALKADLPPSPGDTLPAEPFARP